MLRFLVNCASTFLMLVVCADHMEADEDFLLDDAPSFNRNVKFVLDDDARWSRTSTNKTPLGQGDPTTLTWSIVPDGTPIVPRRETESDEPSNLVSFMNSTYGTGWPELFESVFDRYSSLSGLTYIHESNDDRVAITENGYSAGVIGIRSDIRIGGHRVDQSSQLAYNYFPDNGDMVLDTSDAFLTDRSRLLNLIAHEHGHGLGLGHVYSDDSRPLMQPFIAVDFQGPQFDDILALHRAYGDVLEKKTGNDTPTTASPLGEYQRGRNLVIGDDAILTDVVSSQTDFVSVDGIGDVDFYSFSLGSTTTTSIELQPVGPTYRQGDSRESQSSFDATLQNDLSLELFRLGSQFPLASSSQEGLGESESINRILLGAGNYVVRVSGSSDAAQMYRLTIGEISDAIKGDFNGNGELDVDDVQTLIDRTRAGVFTGSLDLNSDDELDERDLRFWIHNLKNTYFGDSNLDGVFNTTDLIAVFQPAQYEDGIDGNSTWATGDWNGDGDFTTRDLIAAFQDAGFERGTRQSAMVVPEPVTGHFLIATFFVIVSIRSRCRRRLLKMATPVPESVFLRLVSSGDRPVY